MDHDSIRKAYGSNRSHPVILQAPDEVPPVIVVDLLVNPDPAELLEIGWRGTETYPRQDVEQEGTFLVRIFIDTSVRVELRITLSMEAHEALSAY